MAATSMRTDSPSGSAAVLAFPRCPTADRIAAPRQLSETQRLDLERLRWLALRSQLAPKPDLDQACYVLAGQPAVSLDRYATAFFRGLCDNATGEMTIYRPGARAVGDDELWLIRLLDAWRGGEDKLAGALVGWRVKGSARRWMRFLSARMVKALDETRAV